MEALKNKLQEYESQFADFEKQRNDLVRQRQFLATEHQKMVDKKDTIAKELLEKSMRLNAAGSQMAIVTGTIEEFSLKTDWKVCQERLEIYFAVNKVGEERKVQLFLTLLSSEAYSLLRNLCTL